MLEEDVKLRIQFLDRVVQRECTHLNRTTDRLFEEPFTLEKARTISNDDDLSERVEAFVSRFSRLQDTLGDKLIPLILEALGEHQAAAIDNLDKAERFRWIHSADEWLAIRRLRSQMVHDYMEDLNILISAIQTAQKFVATLTNTTQKLHAEIQKRGWVNRV
jgi:uncharacterized protein with HEPN domain